MSKLPTISSDIPKDLRTFTDRIREVINNDLVKLADLLNTGVVTTNAAGTLVAPVVSTVSTTTETLLAPPLPTGLTATAAIQNVILAWDAPAYYGHAYTEVWAADTNNIGVAVLLGSAPGATYVDPLGPNKTRYYWIRFVNGLDEKSAYNSSTGTSATTGTDVSYLLGVLTGQITETQLYATLGNRINLIDGPSSLANSVAARILDEATARNAAILVESNARTTADSAEATTREALAVQMRGSYGGTDVNQLAAGLLYNERTARATADGVLTTNVSLVQAQLSDATTGLPATYARVVNVEEAKIGYCSIGGVPNDYTTKQTCVAAGGTWNVGLPLASAVKQVTVSSGGVTASLEQKFVAQATDNSNFYAQYTIKLDVGGKVSGFGLASTSTSSEFAIRADRFYIAPPASGGGTATQIIPFVVQASATTIGGVAVPAGVYMDTAFIKNGTISTAKIADLAVDNAKIANLTVDKLLAGNIATGQYIRSSNYVSGTSGFNIDATGAAEFQNVTVRGTVYATAGTFAGSLSAATGSFAGSLSAATGSFAGSLSAATGTFSGSLSAATGSFAGSLSAATGSFSGSLSAASGTFSGSLTAGAINAVNTINIAGNAVTIPSGAFTTSSTNLPLNGATVTLQTVSFTATGAPVYIAFTAAIGWFARVFAGGSGGSYYPFSQSWSIYLYRNSVLVLTNFAVNASSSNLGGGTYAGTSPIAVSFSDTPSAGAVTYDIVIGETSYSGQTGYDYSTYGSAVAVNRNLFTLETKR